jgi:hypothetical protein
MTSNDFQYHQQCAVMYNLFTIRLYLDDRFDVRTLADEEARPFWSGVEEMLDYFFEEYSVALERLEGPDSARADSFQRFADSLYAQIGDELEPLLAGANRELRSLLVDFFLILLIPQVSAAFEQSLSGDAWTQTGDYAARYRAIEPMLTIEAAKHAASIVEFGRTVAETEAVAGRAALLYRFLVRNAGTIDLLTALGEE